ncbi:actin-binding protein-like [Punica granatum]|uniref:Actin-binding protein-like n=1 Tax=Punica granatum TaxID=22663 RepID=A0A218WUF5_PUNGR|nr:actin-binding protein-like [Punica granatum]OWM76477.1 hypothetical protein CDL15_Pgr005441 [Punica granatum]
MASPSLNLVLSPPPVASSSSSSQSPPPRWFSSSFQPALFPRSSSSPALSRCVCRAAIRIGDIRLRRRSHIVRMAPEEEKMTRRSPLDFPIEWERPKPGRRPDIFPQFSPMKTPLPPPLPADPPEEDEEEEEKKEEEEEDPEKEADPEKPEKQ